MGNLQSLLCAGIATWYVLTASTILNAAETTCPVDFIIDASHAKFVLDATADGVVTDTERRALINHPITADAVTKTRSYGLDVTAEGLADQIEQVARGEAITSINFGLARYAKHRSGTERLLDQVAVELPAMKSVICEQIRPYVPAGSRFQQTLVILSAVNSTGFTLSDPTKFYVVAEAFNGDMGGLQDLIVHESYHAIQDVMSEDTPWYRDAVGKDTPKDKIVRLLRATIQEGTATHLADPIRAGRIGTMRAFQYRLARRYRRDMDHLFTLFDTTVFRAFYDPDVDYYALHKIGLEGNEGFYHLGAYMTKVIEEYDGPQAVHETFSTHPATFFLRYITLSEENNGYSRFSASTVKIIKEIYAAGKEEE